MANIIARKNKASAAISGEVSSDGLNAMLGDDGDLQTLLLQAIKNNNREEDEDEEAEVSETIQRILDDIALVECGDRSYVPNDKKAVVIDSENDLFEAKLIDESSLVVQTVEETFIDRDFVVNDETASVVESCKKSSVIKKINNKAKPKSDVIKIVVTNKETIKNKKKISENQLSFFEMLG